MSHKSELVINREQQRQAPLSVSCWILRAPFMTAHFA